MPTRRRLIALCMLAYPAARALAQSSAFPNRSVRLIVPYPPGQGADVFARLLAPRLAQKWGQAVYVDNRAGGGGVPGMLQARSAPADGYTLLLAGAQAVLVNPNLYSKLPYDPVKDFQPVSGLYAAPLIFVVNPKSGLTNLKDLVNTAKAQPGRLMFASGGTGSSQHLAGEWFSHLANISMSHVAYKGSAPAMTDLLGGQVTIMVDSVTSALPHLKSGKLTALAVTTSARIPQLPSVPTVAELGYPGYAAIGWSGLFLQPAVPKSIVEKISADVRAILNEPDMRAAIIDQGQVPDPLTPEQATEFIKSDIAKWGEVARAANVKLD